MGIFDIFGTSDQTNAANAQIAGLNSGYNLASGAINTGIGSLNTNYGAGQGALTTGAGQATSALTNNYGQAGTALQNNYTAALQPYLQNYGQAQSGVNQLGNVLGLNGPNGSAQAQQTLQATPGYQFQQNAGDAAINAQAAATGQNASGNQALALSNYNQGLAGTTYNNYVSQLQPFLGASNSAAGGIASGYQGLGSALASNSQGLGQSLAGNYNNLGSGLNANYTGLGNATAGQYSNLGQLGYSTQTGIGNANANADLAGLTASGNIMNLIGSLGGAALGGVGGLGGSLGSALGSSIFGAVPGAVGPSSVGGAPLQNSAYSSIFSDERLKTDIEPVGELYDGTNIFRYRYKGDATPRIGLMAQEVEKTNPDAVVEINGWKAVDYAKATSYSADLARFLEAA